MRFLSTSVACVQKTAVPPPSSPWHAPSPWISRSEAGFMMVCQVCDRRLLSGVRSSDIPCVLGILFGALPLEGRPSSNLQPQNYFRRAKACARMYQIKESAHAARMLYSTWTSRLVKPPKGLVSRSGVFGGYIRAFGPTFFRHNPHAFRTECSEL